MTVTIGRRELLAALGGAAAWPLVARAQQPTLPLVGFLGASSFEASAGRSLLWFKKGLGETGYVEDRNVRIEYRWADDEYERLPSLAMELVHRRVAVLVAGGSPVALPAKAATSEIPVVFMTGLDPVEMGLVASLNHPGGNLTASPTSMPKWLQSGWNCCTSLSQRPGRLHCWSIQPIQSRRGPRQKSCRRSSALSGCISWS